MTNFKVREPFIVGVWPFRYRVWIYWSQYRRCARRIWWSRLRDGFGVWCGPLTILVGTDSAS